MSTYKDFEGKTLDDAIRQACDYFGVVREKLEIDIVNDAKSGIFGLVGAKKACIKAARAHIGGELSSVLTSAVPTTDAPESPDVAEKSPAAAQPAAKPGRETAKTPGKGCGQRGRGSAAPEAPGAPKEQQAMPPRDGCGKSPAAKPGIPSPDTQPRGELSDFALEGCDEAMLFSIVRETVGRLVHPIVGDAPCTPVIAGNRVRVTVDCGDDSALLVGREGQTLASVQYLASRIVAKRINGVLRLQIDAGDYRERQDGKLKELAFALAQKAKNSGRAQSTRPLSAYQRRIIHLTLEEDGEIYTYSKGDGAQRRVVIQSQGDGTRPNSPAAPPLSPSRETSAHAVDGVAPDRKESGTLTFAADDMEQRGQFNG